MTTPTTPPTAPAAPAAAPAPAPVPAPPAGTPTAPASTPSALGDVKANEAKPPAKAIELKLPEGLELPPEALKGFTEIATELGLDSAKAQKVFDQFVGFQQAQSKASEAAFAAQEAKWVDALKADPELQLGGAKWPETQRAIERAKSRFPDAKGAVEVLNAAGLGNHPSVVRLFAAIGRSLKEDSVAGTSAAPPKADRLSDADVFFPTSEPA